jgi:putative transposase
LKGHGFSRAVTEQDKDSGFSRRGKVLKPAREHATNYAQTYFVTSKTWESRALFQTESWARLFFETLLRYRGKNYLLHEFVLMPDHFHLLISPSIALERTVQLIKGGFSYSAKKELGTNGEIWQRGFADHRIRDFEDYDRHVHYIHLNPVKRHLCDDPVEYRYSSAFQGWKLDPVPQGLKPQDLIEPLVGTAEAVPFQSRDCGTTEAVTFKTTTTARLKVVPIQDCDFGMAKAVPFQVLDTAIKR